MRPPQTGLVHVLHTLYTVIMSQRVTEGAKNILYHSTTRMGEKLPALLVILHNLGFPLCSMPHQRGRPGWAQLQM